MSRDDGMDVSPSWQELKDERDGLRQVVARLGAENREIRAERDALAAHVERLFETFNRIAIDGESGMYSPQELEDALCAIFSDGPDTSLDSLKAEWQAEALEEAAADADDDPVTAGWLNERAAMRRLQAKEAP